MTLTITQIYERYSEIDFDRTISVKRMNPDGSYEASWQDLSILLSKYPSILRDSVDAISLKLPNNDYSAGTITSDNVTLNLRNERGQVSNEEDARSIFFGFIRHRSLLKIEDGFTDKFTDPDNPVAVTTETFLGFIDDTLSNSNFNNRESIVVTDLLTTLMKELTVADLGTPSFTDLESLVLVIMDRAHFTDFFTVVVGNINAGFNFTTFDLTQYEDGVTVLELFQDFSIDHSLSIVQGGVFFYKPFTPTSSTIYNFDTTPERKGKDFKDFNSGAKNVRDKLYWEGSNLSELDPDRIYNKSFTYDILGVTDGTNRTNFLAYIIDEVSPRKESFTFPVKFFPTIQILDKIGITREGFLPDDAWIIGNIRLGTSRFRRTIGSIKILGSDRWMVRGIKHDKKPRTWLTVQKV